MVRCCREWADRVCELADHCHVSVSRLIEAALADMVESTGFNQPLPPRIWHKPRHRNRRGS